MKLVLIRHGESEWNKLNLFTGWTDVGLSEKGIIEANEAGFLLKENNFDFDVCYCSYLKRAINTLNIVLERMDMHTGDEEVLIERMDRQWLPVIKTWKLNERHYGALQGLNKAETAEKYGEEQVKLWRRSFDVPPPALDKDDKRCPHNQAPYRNVDKSELPYNESLKDTIERVIPYYEEVIKKDMLDGKRVLITAHGNSLRALVKYLDNLTDEEIISVNIPTGIPLVYEFDDNFKVTNKYYLGNQDEINAKINSVANQAKKK